MTPQQDAQKWYNAGWEDRYYHPGGIPESIADDGILPPGDPQKIYNLGYNDAKLGLPENQDAYDTFYPNGTGPTAPATEGGGAHPYQGLPYWYVGNGAAPPQTPPPGNSVPLWDSDSPFAYLGTGNYTPNGPVEPQGLNSGLFGGGGGDNPLMDMLMMSMFNK